MVDINEFIKMNHVIECKSKVYANASNGRHLIFDEDNSKYIEADSSEGSLYNG